MTKRNAPVADAEVIVVGAGPAGLALAIALAQEGVRTVLLGEVRTARDGRTVALFDPSIRLLDAIGAWHGLQMQAAPLVHMRLVDATDNLFRPPPVTFNAGEIGLDAFGYNIENATLVSALSALADRTAKLVRVAASATAFSAGHDLAEVSLDDGSILRAPLVVAADGRNSRMRADAGIETREWSYPQTAVTAILSNSRDHRDTSTEFHTRSGPFTLVPLPGLRSSLVWVCSPHEAERLAALDDESFALAVERQAHSMLGRMRLEGGRGSVPMSGLAVSRFTGNRIAVAGEAAHVFPPIGAQGLNLGIRDVANLRDAVIDARTRGLDIGSPEALAPYERGRRLDVRMRTRSVDALNRTLLAHFLPADLLRGAGLIALDLIGPLRRFVMREGLAPHVRLPRLMSRTGAADPLLL